MSNALVFGRGADERWQVRKNGDRFWANGEMMPLKAANGSTIGFIKILRDRTGPRLAEDRIRASEKRWRELFGNMGEGFFLGELVRDAYGKGIDYSFLEMNPASVEQLGIPATSVGQTIRTVAPDVPQWLIDRYALTVDTGMPQHFERHIPETGRWLEVRSRKEAGDRFSSLFIDITARKDAEALLVESDERLKASLNASGAVGLWDWMLDTKLLHGDYNFAHMYGLDPQKCAAGVTLEEYQEFVVAEDLPQLNAKLLDVFESDADFLSVYRVTVPDMPVRWVECKGRIVRVDGRAPRFITVVKNAEQQKQLLMEEMAHRVKNTFSVVQAIASQTLGKLDPAVSSEFQQRLVALGNAHNLLLQTSWEPTDIHVLIDSVLKPQVGAERLVLEGPDVPLGPKAALSISMLLHEMTTNAVKYGSLSVADGKIEISWVIDGDDFCLRWKETGGPPATPPTRTGFGSRLIGLGINASRKVERQYGPDGLRAGFFASASAIGQA